MSPLSCWDALGQAFTSGTDRQRQERADRSLIAAAAAAEAGSTGVEWIVLSSSSMLVWSAVDIACCVRQGGGERRNGSELDSDSLTQASELAVSRQPSARRLLQDQIRVYQRSIWQDLCWSILCAR